jgi:hypothetical protein
MSDGLQFDKAEFATAAAKACAVCRKPIADTYFEAVGSILCADCAAKLAANSGGFPVLSRAALWGAAAALAGTIVWYLISTLLHIELAIIAIAIGYAVGYAVRRAARGVGGWKYQALAMFLTYASIVSSYVPTIIKQLSAASLERGPLTVFTYAFQAPFLGGANNVIGLLIIAIGLYEAWKLNRRIPISGPFRVGAAPAAGPPAVEPPPGPPAGTP